ncbi:PspC domain-containing protein [Bombilactobacillus thymidiniphilus]|uniref:PspC domain-containing protein n=1 Tax=Bombilactobacillus thymidiniphilus TaxID=2923363 RepID=A0ABY4PCN8_9LACO|nr:PspC domain-containing protein [Bombilactobacillus thymidiniphilus]UQS83524.1 PspC domain-containing protein [Bombilactobacillus thymidiniphilus]
MHINIYRSATNRVFGGVLGGLADYFDWNANVLRIIWVLATICFHVIFILAYFVLLLLMKNPYN